MNVIIQTGFEAISHNISFHPQTMNKGKLLVTADHVRDVEEFRQCGKSHLIKSKVIRQASITLFPYDTNLHFPTSNWKYSKKLAPLSIIAGILVKKLALFSVDVSSVLNNARTNMTSYSNLIVIQKNEQNSTTN
ncbi:hypothetical protein PV325_005998 [Microctonus aethiopoides]|nr:hypothetical protein PV325_005998 [Microctonus aethiopoides]KAK0082045.1 hypothetical protein PV326_007367 [Microctonus aethiopoides]